MSKAEGGRWKAEGGRWKVEGGRRKVEGGRWKVGGGRWEVEGKIIQAGIIICITLFLLPYSSFPSLINRPSPLHPPTDIIENHGTDDGPHQENRADREG